LGTGWSDCGFGLGRLDFSRHFHGSRHCGHDDGDFRYAGLRQASRDGGEFRRDRRQAHGCLYDRRWYRLTLDCGDVDWRSFNANASRFLFDDDLNGF
jgi:hypothetical protein